MQGPLTQWVTDHRKHHALSDQEGDPHSPHVGHGDGVWGAVKGFVHAHVGWLFTLKGMERGRDYGKDLYEDRLVRTIDRIYLRLGRPHLRHPVRVRLRLRRQRRAGVEARSGAG